MKCLDVLLVVLGLNMHIVCVYVDVCVFGLILIWCVYGLCVVVLSSHMDNIVCVVCCICSYRYRLCCVCFVCCMLFRCLLFQLLYIWCDGVVCCWCVCMQMMRLELLFVVFGLNLYALCVYVAVCCCWHYVNIMFLGVSGCCFVFASVEHGLCCLLLCSYIYIMLFVFRVLSFVSLFVVSVLVCILFLLFGVCVSVYRWCVWNCCMLFLAWICIYDVFVYVAVCCYGALY